MVGALAETMLTEVEQAVVVGVVSEVLETGAVMVEVERAVTGEVNVSTRELVVGLSFGLASSGLAFGLPSGSGPAPARNGW